MDIRMDRVYIIGCLVITLTALSQGAPFMQEKTIGEYRDTYQEQVNKIFLETSKLEMKLDGNSVRPFNKPPLAVDLKAEEDDIKYTIEEALARKRKVMEKLGMNKKRVKRKILDDSSRFWKLPIIFKIDQDNLNETYRQLIRNALHHIESHTVLRFQEKEYEYCVRKNRYDPIPYYNGAKCPDQYLYFTTDFRSCSSFVGKVEHYVEYPQRISLAVGKCTNLGTTIHEMLHAAGLVHEHMRPARKGNLHVYENRINAFYKRNFEIVEDTYLKDSLVPYDFNSVMQYRPDMGSTTRGNAMEPYDMHYLSNMGQRTEMSFLDAKAINLGYKNFLRSQRYPNGANMWPCEGVGAPTCRNGGYQDPNRCTMCKCPPGLDPNNFCDYPSSYQTQNSWVFSNIKSQDSRQCGGNYKLYVDGYGDPYITFKFHNDGWTRYSDHAQCTWIFKAPSPNYKVELQFVDNFAVYKQNYLRPQCTGHYVEVNLNSTDFSDNGYRFCGSQTPNGKFLSSAQHMMVRFNANATSGSRAYYYRGGFTFKVKAVAASNQQERSNPTTEPPTVASVTMRQSPRPSPSSTTTSRPRTRPRTRPTTTSSTVASTSTERPIPPTTKPPPKSGGNGWSAWFYSRPYCHCGGAASRVRYRTCGGDGQICTGKHFEMESENFPLPCRLEDMIQIHNGKPFTIKCAECDYGFQISNERNICE